MATTVTTRPSSTRANSPARFRLAGRTRKAVLVLHIASAGAWIGIDVVMAVLVFTAMSTGDDSTRAVCYQVLELVTVWPMLASGAVCLVTGVVLGLGSRYGLVRYWWVGVKLLLNVLLMVLVWFALRPGVRELAEQGRLLAAGKDVVVAAGDMVFPPIVSPSLLLLAVILSVFKPWGRIRRGP